MNESTPIPFRHLAVLLALATVLPVVAVSAFAFQQLASSVRRLERNATASLEAVYAEPHLYENSAQGVRELASDLAERNMRLLMLASLMAGGVATGAAFFLARRLAQPVLPDASPHSAPAMSPDEIADVLDRVAAMLRRNRRVR